MRDYRYICMRVYNIGICVSLHVHPEPYACVSIYPYIGVCIYCILYTFSFIYSYLQNMLVLTAARWMMRLETGQQVPWHHAQNPHGESFVPAASLNLLAHPASKPGSTAHLS